MAKFDLLRTSINGSEYHGIWRNASSPSALAVHVHGTGGDFFSNPFIEPLSDVYADRGISYLAANFPGWGQEATVEKFDDFTPALESWIAQIGWAGKIVLQGHSLGALKILRYLRRGGKLGSRLAGLVMLSPFDIVSFYCGKTDDSIFESRAKITKLLASGNSSDAVPQDVFDLWPISIGTFLELTAEGGVADQFPSRKGCVGEYLSNLRVPTLVAIGSSDFAAFPSPDNVVFQLKNKPILSAVLIENAPHNFAGAVSQLSDEVGKWLSGNID